MGSDTGHPQAIIVPGEWHIRPCPACCGDGGIVLCKQGIRSPVAAGAQVKILSDTYLDGREPNMTRNEVRLSGSTSSGGRAGGHHRHDPGGAGSAEPGPARRRIVEEVGW